MSAKRNGYSPVNGSGHRRHSQSPVGTVMTRFSRRYVRVDPTKRVGRWQYVHRGGFRFILLTYVKAYDDDSISFYQANP
jgi:hypothetical protein